MNKTPSKSSGSIKSLVDSPASTVAITPTREEQCLAPKVLKEDGGFSPFPIKTLFPSNTTVLNSLEDSSNAAEVAFILMCDKFIDFSNCC